MKRKIEITIDDTNNINEINVLGDGAWRYTLIPPKITTEIWEDLNEHLKNWVNQVKRLAEHDEITGGKQNDKT